MIPVATPGAPNLVIQCSVTVLASSFFHFEFTEVAALDDLTGATYWYIIMTTEGKENFFSLFVDIYHIVNKLYFYFRRCHFIFTE